MKLLAWSIEENENDTYTNARYLIESAAVFNEQVEFIGVGKKFVELFDKITTLRDYINNLSKNTFLVCIDGYDTLLNKDLSTLKDDFEKHNTKVIISTERIFTYQWNTFKDKFETISSPYRYVNSGTLIGYSDDLKIILDECIELNKIYPTEIDQGIVGVWVYKNLENTNRVKLDIDCEFTWVVSGEWETLGKISENPEIINPTTGNKPYIIHSPGNGATSNFIPFKKAYKSIIKSN
jgi:hypothetical protein